MIRLIAVVGLFLSWSLNADCLYFTEQNAGQLEWTAFKFTEKTPVKGKFTNYKITSKPNKDPMKLLRTVEIEVDGLRIDSGDASRDSNLHRGFFSLLRKHAKIKGKLKQIPNKSEGKATLELEMNGKKKVFMVPFEKGDSEIVFTGAITAKDFGLEKALENIHRMCEALHTGGDGTPRTWEDFEFKFTLPWKSKC